MHREAIEDYDHLIRPDPDTRCAAVVLRPEEVGLDRFDEGLSK